MGGWRASRGRRTAVPGNAVRRRLPVVMVGMLLSAGCAAPAAMERQEAAGTAPAHDADPSAITFAEHVAPIVFEHCTPCHRPGEAAPFPLMTYEDVAKRGRRIAAVTRDRYMPPWKAEPGSFPFRDERRLTEAQIATIQRWVESGMPKGDLAKAPPLPVFPAGWRLGEPDLVIEMPEGFAVPADGPDVYRNFVIPLGLDEDRWIRAIEFRPSAREAVHHVLFFADASGAGREADAADPGPGYEGMGPGGLGMTSLGGWAIGHQPHAYPEGIAMPLPRGADLILQFHFHPTGRPDVERSAIGLHFADRAPDRLLTAIQLPPLFGYFAGIDIPAGASDFQVEDAFELPVDVEAVAVGAHAHHLGREMQMTAVLPDGRELTLLRIGDWDFAWQDRYFFRELVPLPKGTRLRAFIRWDNSAGNPHNPSDPPVRVRWGTRSIDEMGCITLQVLPRRPEDHQELRAAYRQHVAAAVFGRRR